jgi:alanine racemase
MKYQEPLRALISESAFCWNLRQIIRSLPAHCKVFPVLKANAYGHGVSLAVDFLKKNFNSQQVPMVCVARSSEALELSKMGFKRKILCLNEVFDANSFGRLLSKNNQIGSVLSSWQDFDQAYRRGVPFFHVDFNTGMNRLGMDWDIQDVQLRELVRKIKRLEQKGFRLEGIMSHLACGENGREGFSLIQEKRFVEIKERFLNHMEMAGVSLRKRNLDFHISNSAGAFFQIAENHINAVRCGLSLWGSASEEKMAIEISKKIKLRPVMKVESDLRQLRVLPKGEGLGYGHHFKAERDSLIGIFCLGYADGFLRHFPKNHIGLVVEGEWMPVVGRVSMDLCAVDLTDHTQAAKWQSLKFSKIKGLWIGPTQTAEKIATQLGTIPYEIFCAVGSRAQRIGVL